MDQRAKWKDGWSTRRKQTPRGDPHARALGAAAQADLQPALARPGRRTKPEDRQARHERLPTAGEGSRIALLAGKAEDRLESRMISAPRTL